MKSNNAITIFLFLIIMSFQIISSDIYYMDDIFRHVLWYSGWSGDGRPFADTIYNIISFGNSIVDMHPMPLIGSIGLFSLTMYYYAKNNNISLSYIYMVSCSVIIINPFFVSNLWFRFDGPFMVLSICFAIIPFCANIKNKFVQLVFSSFFVLMALGLYQTSINVFLGFIFIELIVKITNEKLSCSIKQFVYRFSSAIVAILLYKFTTSKIYPMNDYAAAYSKTIELDYNGLLTLINNVKIALDGLNVALLSFWIYIIPCTIVVLCALIKKTCNHSKISLIMALVSVVSLFFLSFGVIVLSNNMVVYPRVYLGFGCFLFLLFILVSQSKLKPYIRYAIILVPYSIMSVYFFIENSSIKAEYIDKNELAQRLVYDISNNSEINNKCIMIINYPKISKVAEMNLRAYPYSYNVLPKTFSPGYDGGRFLLMSNGLKDIRYQSESEEKEIIESISTIKPTINNDTYELYGIGNCTAIKFK
ncbi:glucosyltransferase domain-containing protein [Citrobacter portucalensis]|uniref:glucosyltransferase domain-containing protein n=2 Tax=Citrobacter portucalensis TaxID=1639133 RepID=UPI003314F6DB